MWRRLSAGELVPHIVPSRHQHPWMRHAGIAAIVACLFVATPLHSASIQFNEQFVPDGVDLVHAAALQTY